MEPPCSTTAGSCGTRPHIQHRAPCSQLPWLLPQTCSVLSFLRLGEDVIEMALGEAEPF